MVPFGNLYKLLPLFLRVCIFLSISIGDLDKSQDSLRSNLRSDNIETEHFDFVIVGAGSAGSVLANRLSEKFKVLLLEAGGRSSFVSRLPIFAFPMFGEIPEDWKYETVPLKHAGFGLNNNVTKWPSGKGLGGSSLINGMIYIRGTVQGFDIMADQIGDPIWKMKNVLRYYKKIESYDGFSDKGHHGQNGRIVVSKGHLSPYVKNLMRAGEELGYKVRDPNPEGPLTEGFAPMELYAKNGIRWSAYHGYIKPVLRRRSTLSVRKYAYVYKVILDEEKTATGVEYLRHGKRYVAKASKEVILSAGAIQSPKILMLSGIGPKEDLEKLKIPVRVDLPVGQRLQDKYGMFLGPFTVDPGNSFVFSRQITHKELYEFLFQGKGPFTTSQADATYNIRSSYALRSGRTTPDIHAYVLSIPMDKAIESLVLKGSFNFKQEIVEKYLSQAYGKDTVIKLMALNKPVSFGSLKLRDSNPESPLLIDPNYFSDRRDVDTLVEGVKFAVKVMEETKSMKLINTKLLPTPIPGCEHLEFRSDVYWECLARHMTATAYKYCSTAPMGKNISDPIAVVDSRLRVFGTKRLRVIDASVLQERYVSVNHVTCTALGELASDFILNEYKS